MPFTVEDLPEVTGTTEPSQLMLASKQVVQVVQAPGSPATQPASAPPTATPASRPLFRDAAPVDALPASRVRSVGGSASRSTTSSSEQAANAPLSVVLATTGDGGSVALANRVASGLRAAGRDVKLAAVSGAGRPDVLLVIDAAGAGSTQAWYCDPGPAGNATLAESLLRDVPGSSGDGAPSREIEAAFSCKEVHAGRAQTAAVLLDLPSSAAVGETTANAISSAVNRYLDDNAAAIREAKTRKSLVWPASGPITSHFGPSHPLGIDIGQGQGSIVAAADGKVVFAGGNACCSYGLYVVIEGAGGMHTLYAHLNRIDVKVGQTVRQGQSLGPVGCTGYCLGIHLHFEVFLNGNRVDPMLFLP